ncbi:hypothetical protein F511_05442 [Dorcoceras hygrometricum]|uniref:Uncharacterized protein n=1 Tax=Dorcoceras hygrometricum TaxID=472368 RepID=A0A2Z7BU60_9LAMI|nr:hypothetical protein F511_05442 [Dorcoceras hygrometricum]
MTSSQSADEESPAAAQAHINQQMVRVQQMKRDQLLCKQALKQRESWISDDDISSDVITTSRFSRCFRAKIQQVLFSRGISSRGKSSRKHLKPTTGQPAASISLPPAEASSRKLYASSRKLCVSSRHGIQSQESRCSGELQSRRKISSRSI